MYLARVLEDDGDDVTLLDFSCEPFDEKKLIKEVISADIVGLSVLSFALENSKEIVRNYNCS